MALRNCLLLLAFLGLLCVALALPVTPQNETVKAEDEGNQTEIDLRNNPLSTALGIGLEIGASALLGYPVGPAVYPPAPYPYPYPPNPYPYPPAGYPYPPSYPYPPRGNYGHYNGDYNHQAHHHG